MKRPPQWPLVRARLERAVEFNIRPSHDDIKAVLRFMAGTSAMLDAVFGQNERLAAQYSAEASAHDQTLAELADLRQEVDAIQNMNHEEGNSLREGLNRAYDVVLDLEWSKTLGDTECCPKCLHTKAHGMHQNDCPIGIVLGKCAPKKANDG
jgi:hypothetical protein